MAMAERDPAAAVTRRYDALLARRHLDSTVEVLARAAERDGLRYGDQPVCRVLRPAFVSARQYDRARRAARFVARGLFEASRRLLSDAKLRRACLVSDAALRLMRVEERNRAPQVVGRLDGFLSPSGGYQIIEYSGTPGGLVYGDGLARAFESTPIVAELRRRHRLRTIAGAARVPQAYRRAHREFGGRGVPAVAIVDKGMLELATNFETRALLAELENRGFAVHVVRSEQLAFRRGRLLADGHAVDAVYYIDEEVLEPVGEDALVRALERRAIWLVVGPRGGLWYNKAVFELLSDPAHAGLFDPAVARALARHVPWTRVVREGRTTLRGETIDLMPFVAKSRDTLVLKPAYGAGGSGVVVGHACTESKWRSTLEKALTIPHVVQERVELGGGEFPFLRDGALDFAHFNAGLDPYVWNGDTVSGCLVRLSRTPVLNVASLGGSMVPMFVVDE